MGQIQVNQIKDELFSRYDNLIDLSDVKGKNTSKQQLDELFLTRALNALAIECLTNGDRCAIAQSITDGSRDNGIDAIYFDQENTTLYLSQAKFNHKGDTEPELGDIKKFKDGINDLISYRFNKFNDKIKSRDKEIEEILSKYRNLKIVVILAYTANNFSPLSQSEMDEFINDQNDSGDVWRFEKFNQTRFYTEIQKAAETRIDIPELLLTEWGKKESPKLAYYGQIDGLQLAELFKLHGNNLFDKNIRKLLPDTDINKEIDKTIIDDPDNFWYYNNGITMVCDKITKLPANGNNRDYAKFYCENASVINGAQTIGTIGRHYMKSTDDDKLAKVKIAAKIISINQDEQQNDQIVDMVFAENITKYNNRQNNIENRDFVSLDPEQKRIASELKLQNVFYHISRSYESAKDENNFDLNESTRALSNALSIEASTLFHREPNLVWSDINHSRYKRIFNPSLSSYYLWNCVNVQRVIDACLKTLKSSVAREERAIITYGEDVISCIIFNRVKAKISDKVIGIENVFNGFSLEDEIKKSHALLKKEVELIDKGTPTIFKNFTHCNDIYNSIIKIAE